MSATAVHSLWTTAAGPLGTIPSPHIEYAQLAPVLIVAGAAMIGVLFEAFVPRGARYYAQVFLAVIGLAAAFASVVALAADGYATTSKAHIAAMGAVAVDGPSLFLQGTILLTAVFAVFTFAERRLDPAQHGSHIDSFAAEGAAVPGSDAEKAATKAGFTTTEVFPLVLFAVAGMLVFPAANDLLTLFVALEVFSLPLYLLCALARRTRLMSQEAAVKYFLLGAFSSAFLLFGIALLYGYAGSVTYSQIAAVVDGTVQNVDPALAGTMGNDALLLIGGAMLLMGLLFKVGAIPFHMWTPDVYQGAPTPVTGFMAAATKVAAFGALLRLLYVVLPGLTWDWRPVMWGVAIITMIGGAIVAITQTDIKRLLAYSSIAHAGFILAGVIAATPDGISSVLFYLVAYSFVTLGAFAVVTLVRDAGGEATHLSKWAGLGRRSPLVAAVFGLFLLAFAGIPLTSGFAGKFAVFKAAAAGGAVPLVVIGVIASAIAAFFYIRVIVLMFFSEPKPDGPTVAIPSPLTMVTIGVGAAVVLVFGLAPQYFLDLAGQASVFAR
jgi:NADH-quinone oxidoreductase subunit N